MKRFITLLSLIISTAISLAAQPKIYIEGTMFPMARINETPLSFNFSYNEDDNLRESRPILILETGIQYRYSRWDFSLGLQISDLEFVGNPVVPYGDVTYNVWWMDVPMMASWTIMSADKMSLFAGIGPYLGFKLSETVSCYYTDEQFGNLDSGLTMKAGVCLWNHAMITLKYNHGFVDVFAAGAYPPTSRVHPSKAYRHSLGLFVGYLF
jgi:hypothetical protein